MRFTVLKRFSPDPHRAPATMTEDQREHPVVALIRRRRDEGSTPGARADGRRVALVIEGGGMRGVVSAGMTAAIEQLGLRDSFDEVHGASAGAFNAAFLLAHRRRDQKLRSELLVESFDARGQIARAVRIGIIRKQGRN